MLCLQFFYVFFSEQEASLLRLGSRHFFYTRLANHSAVSKPHPAEGAGIYRSMQAAGFLAAIKCAVRCARPSVLVVVHPDCVVHCSFVVVTLPFSNVHDILLGNKQNAYEHIHPPQMTRAYLA